MVCMLPPLNPSGKGQTHSASVVDERTTLNHLKSNAHASALEFFDKLKNDGKSNEFAATETIKWATNQRHKSMLKMPQGTSNPTDEAKRVTHEVALLLWSAEKSISFESFESELFKKALSVYGLRSPPRADRLSNAILQNTYNLVTMQQDEQLSQVDYFSITADAATLKFDSSTRYVALTLHAILHDFTMFRCMFALIPVNKGHSWYNLAMAVSARIDARLPRDAVLVTTTTDQGSNFMKMAAALHLNLDQASIEGLGPDDWDEPLPNARVHGLDPTATFQCAAHRMHNAALDLYRTAQFVAVVDEVRNLVTFIRGSPATSDAFARVQRSRLEAAFPNDKAKHQPKQLVLDVKTRWLYMHEMMQRFASCADDIMVMGVAGMLDKYDGPILTFEKVSCIREMCSVLEPAAEFVRAVEGEKYVTIALIPVLLAKCIKAVQPDPLLDSDDVSALKRAFSTSIMTRLGREILSQPNLALAAAALHPAFGHLKFVEERVRDAMWATLAQWATEFPTPRAPVAPRRGPGPAIPQGAQPSLDELTRDFNAVRISFEGSAPNDPLEVRSGEGFDPLKWWADAHGAASKRISHIARLVLSVPGSSAPSERVFSLANLVVTQMRNNLLDYKVEQLTIIRHHAAVHGATAVCEFVSTQIKDFVGDDNDDKKRKAPADLQLPQQPDRRASGANAVEVDDVVIN